jgi:hypothetical protein
VHRHRSSQHISQYPRKAPSSHVGLASCMARPRRKGAQTGRPSPKHYATHHHLRPIGPHLQAHAGLPRFACPA